MTSRSVWGAAILGGCRSRWGHPDARRGHQGLLQERRRGYRPPQLLANALYLPCPAGGTRTVRHDGRQRLGATEPAGRSALRRRDGQADGGRTGQSALDPQRRPLSAPQHLRSPRTNDPGNRLPHQHRRAVRHAVGCALRISPRSGIEAVGGWLCGGQLRFRGAKIPGRHARSQAGAAPTRAVGSVVFRTSYVVWLPASIAVSRSLLAASSGTKVCRADRDRIVSFSDAAANPLCCGGHDNATGKNLLIFQIDCRIGRRAVDSLDGIWPDAREVHDGKGFPNVGGTDAEARRVAGDRCCRLAALLCPRHDADAQFAAHRDQPGRLRPAVQGNTTVVRTGGTPAAPQDPVSLFTTAKPGVELYVAVARLYEENGRLAEAEQQYRKGLQAAPDDLRALLGYARLKDRLGQTDEVAESLPEGRQSASRRAFGLQQSGRALCAPGPVDALGDGHAAGDSLAAQGSQVPRQHRHRADPIGPAAGGLRPPVRGP